MPRPAALPLFFLLALGSCAHLPPEAQAPPVTYVERDAEWSGTVRVDGVVHVRKGATLRIRPGTRVEFSRRRFGTSDEHEGFFASGMRVEGRIVAEGTEDDPVVFAPEEGPARPGSWDKILFAFSGGNRFRHCVFEGARYAFHSHFSEIEIRECLFRENQEGVRLGASRVRIADSVFTRNEVRGINFRECRNEIRGNLVYGNGDGIFLHSKDSLSVIRGNAVYANRGYNLRLGDLHAEDIDVSGNWWGTPEEGEARKTIYDGSNLAGLGSARISPVLSRPPVSGAEIRGVFVRGMTPVSGGEVRAYLSVAEGLWTDAYVAKAAAGENGEFRIPVPPGRYFVVGRAGSGEGALFAFPGKNPVAAALRETAEVGLPAVLAPPPAVASAAPGDRSSVVARATSGGVPVAGASIQAFRPEAPDFRGPGEASAVTDEEGTARLYLPPGEWFLAAKKRTRGEAIGMVDEGGLFGLYPHSPLRIGPRTSVSVEIPLFEKRGILAGEDAPPGRERFPEEEAYAGIASVGGRPAEGYVVYFYLPPETIGRPVARSSPAGRDGAFTVSLPAPGEYLAYLRKSVPGLPAGTEEERTGPVAVRAEGGRCLPSPLPFPPAEAKAR